MKVLVGEDDKAIAEVVSIILTGEGHEVIHVSDEKSLTDSLAKKPQLILLDIGLGGADGGVIAARLKSDKAYRSIPIIIMSANDQTETVAKKSGADGFLLKPFEIDDLTKVVASYSSPLS